MIAWQLVEKRREAARYEAYGAQRPRHIKQIGEEASTAQRRGWVPQQFFNKLLGYDLDSGAFSKHTVSRLIVVLP